MHDLRSAGYLVLEQLVWSGGSALVVACDAPLQDDAIVQIRRTSAEIAKVEKFNESGYAGKPAG